jgi:hypothetical protein
VEGRRRDRAVRIRTSTHPVKHPRLSEAKLVSFFIRQHHSRPKVGVVFCRTECISLEFTCATLKL